MWLRWPYRCVDVLELFSFFLLSSWVHLKRRTDQNIKSIVPTKISHSTVNTKGNVFRLTRASHTAHFIVTTFLCCIIQVMLLFGSFQHIAPFTCGQLQIFNIEKICDVAFVRSLNQKRFFFLQKLLSLVCPTNNILYLFLGVHVFCCCPHWN